MDRDDVIYIFHHEPCESIPHSESVTGSQFGSHEIFALRNHFQSNHRVHHNPSDRD